MVVFSCVIRQRKDPFNIMAELKGAFEGGERKIKINIECGNKSERNKHITHKREVQSKLIVELLNPGKCSNENVFGQSPWGTPAPSGDCFQCGKPGHWRGVEDVGGESPRGSLTDRSGNGTSHRRFVPMLKRIRPDTAGIQNGGGRGVPVPQSRTG